MKNFFIITNPGKDPNLEVTKKIQEKLEKESCSHEIVVCQKSIDSDTHRYTNPSDVPEKTDCIIVVGGDGTLLHAARDLVALKIPVIGVNSGKLGYLAEVETNNIDIMLEKLVNDQYVIESRMMLHGKVLRNGENVGECMALNDIIINRSKAMRVSDYKISINGNYLCVYSADGVIISTPTGATAYNLSAGGPIAEPSSRIILMTPICAHSLNSRSIVFSEETEIEIEICKDKNGVEGDKLVSFDGDYQLDLIEGDKVIIGKSDLYTNIIKLSSISFLELLRKKMG